MIKYEEKHEISSFSNSLKVPVLCPNNYSMPLIIKIEEKPNSKDKQSGNPLWMEETVYQIIINYIIIYYGSVASATTLTFSSTGDVSTTTATRVGVFCLMTGVGWWTTTTTGCFCCRCCCF